jgi:hypothetical protein
MLIRALMWMTSKLAAMTIELADFELKPALVARRDRGGIVSGVQSVEEELY